MRLRHYPHNKVLLCRIYTIWNKRYLGKGGNFLLEELLNSSAGKCPIEVDFCTFEETERVLTEENPLGPNSSLCNVQIQTN